MKIDHDKLSKLGSLDRDIGMGNCEDMLYSTKELKDNFKFETILPDRLIVVSQNDGCTYHFNFLEQRGSLGGEDYWQELMSVTGPSEGLRECRHTRIADDGYIFYMNRENMIAVLDYLTLYYDMD